MTEYALGASVSCTDGSCGVLSRTILDPAARTVTHLVIVPKHHHEEGRLVPLALIESTAGEIRLRCTLAEFARLEPAEEVEVVESGYGGGYGQAGAVQGYGDAGTMGGGVSASGMGIGMGLGHGTPVMVSHAVPVGETEVEPHESVHAVDGEIGRVEGFLVSPADNKVTHVLLQEGHLWGRKQVAIPISAVASVDAGIRLNITKKQVEGLPPVDPASSP